MTDRAEGNDSEPRVPAERNTDAAAASTAAAETLGICGGGGGGGGGAAAEEEEAAEAEAEVAEAISIPRPEGAAAEASNGAAGATRRDVEFGAAAPGGGDGAAGAVAAGGARDGDGDAAPPIGREEGGKPVGGAGSDRGGAGGGELPRTTPRYAYDECVEATLEKMRTANAEVGRAMMSTRLNAMYGSLERMRRANLEVEFGEALQFGDAIDFGRCTQCLRESILPGEGSADVGADVGTPPGPKRLFAGRGTAGPAGRGVRRLLSELPRNRARPCLICASPACPRHACPSFRREGVDVCGGCAPLFSLDFIVDCVRHDAPRHRRAHLDRMVDVYDRALLVLKYSAQYIDGVAGALERNTRRNNRVGIGSSATGLVSGVTGVVAAATILTPAGPPLLIASLLFGGSATAASAGSEAVNYYSEPAKVANNIIALHSMVRSLSRLTGVVRDALLRDHIRVDHYLEGAGERPPTKLGGAIERVQRTLERESSKMALGGAAAAGKYTAAATEIGGLVTAAELGGLTAARSSRLWSRAATNTLRAARVARFAAGALSAATIALEAREMASVVRRVRAGHPCEKAAALRAIKDEMGSLPDTAVLARECDSYLTAMASRPIVDGC